MSIGLHGAVYFSSNSIRFPRVNAPWLFAICFGSCKNR